MTTEEKACIECNELWPNDAEFFHRGRGTAELLSVCHACFEERYSTPSRRSKELQAMTLECSPTATLQGAFHDLVNASQKQKGKRA